MSTIVPARVNWSLYKGVDFEFDGQWIHNGSPMDLSGAVFDCAVFKNKIENTPILLPVYEALNASQGYFRLSVEGDLLSSVDTDSGILVVKVTIGGKTQKLLSGHVNITL